MNNLELADKLQATAAQHYGDLCGMLWDGGAALRKLHTENTALRVTEENLRAANAELVEALKGVIESRDKNSFSREVYVTAEESDLGPYWSPAATMVDSHAICNARAALAKTEGGGL